MLEWVELLNQLPDWAHWARHRNGLRDQFLHHLVHAQVFYWRAQAPRRVEACHVGGKRGSSFSNLSESADGLNISLASVLVTNGSEQFPTLASHFEAVVKEFVQKSFVENAHLNVVNAPGVASVQESIELAAFDVVQE